MKVRHLFCKRSSHPETLELFQILCRSTCPYSQRHQGLPSGCPHSMALQDITRRWMASFRDSFSCRAWLEHMQSESLLAVEFFTPGGLESVCLLDALRALDSACAEDGIKARALLLSTEGEPRIRLAMSPRMESSDQLRCSSTSAPEG